MRSVMASAHVGDDIYDGDPTVTALQNMAADMLGKEAALFAPSGTQTNLIALLCHCQRGDEYLVGQQAHTYKYEGGGAAVLGSIQPQPIELDDDGTLDLEKVAAAIKPYDQHFAKTRLFCLENTIGGKVLPLDYILKAGDFCHSKNLSMHLDGARIFNASVALGVDVKELVAPFDTVSICLSKGLGTPVGSLLVGSKAIIEKAIHWRKMLGGGMRQAGIIAAAGVYALENNISSLQNDHAHADLLADLLSCHSVLNIDETSTRTNMVFIDAPKDGSDKLVGFLEQNDIKIFGGDKSGDKIRLVTHRDIHEKDIRHVASVFDRYFESNK